MLYMYTNENADPIASIESTRQLQARTTASVICASQNTLAEPLFTVLDAWERIGSRAGSEDDRA